MKSPMVHPNKTKIAPRTLGPLFAAFLLFAALPALSAK
jgi:hypothetical protein